MEYFSSTTNKKEPPLPFIQTTLDTQHKREERESFTHILALAM
jgi:hypothetical protein